MSRCRGKSSSKSEHETIKLEHKHALSSKHQHVLSLRHEHAMNSCPRKAFWWWPLTARKSEAFSLIWALLRGKDPRQVKSWAGTGVTSCLSKASWEIGCFYYFRKSFPKEGIFLYIYLYVLLISYRFHGLFGFYSFIRVNNEGFYVYMFWREMF